LTVLTINSALSEFIWNIPVAYYFTRKLNLVSFIYRGPRPTEHRKEHKRANSLKNTRISTTRVRKEHKRVNLLTNSLQGFQQQGTSYLAITKLRYAALTLTDIRKDPLFPLCS